MYEKYNLKKRGIAPIIATVLIILLTILAASIIAGFIIPFVKDNLEQSSACVPYRDYFKFEEVFEYKKIDGTIENYRFNCYYDSTTSKSYGFSVSTKSNETGVFEKIAGFDVVLFKEDEREIVKVRGGEGTTSGVKMLVESRPIEIPVNGIETYVYTTESEIIFEKAEIHPILKSGNTCEESDVITIVPCAPNINGFNIQP